MVLIEESNHSDVRVEVSALGDHEGIERESEIVNIHCHLI